MKFLLETDHKPLENIQKKSLASTPPRLQRLMLRIQGYDCTIKYRPGKEMALADALFCLNPKPEGEIYLDATIHTVHFSKERFQKLKEHTNKDGNYTCKRKSSCLAGERQQKPF